MIGNNIGKYKIIRLIGEGGMASVYEAEHEMLGTKVAVKVLNPLLSGNAQIKERFRNEAKLMASLDHANITKVLDFDEQPQHLSIVMEFLEGEDLNDKIKRNGALPEKEVFALFQQILSAFQYAHEKGIVHRDIKPSNIFILPDGRVKILDFGIAKLFGQGNEMTQTGTQMGTPIYMSPEQVKADKSIDHRSDIYSLGVTMFYALHGKPPYNSDTDSQFDIFSKIVYEPLPILSIPGDFTELLAKACNKNREERFQSCEEWQVALNGKSSPQAVFDYTRSTGSVQINLEGEINVGTQVWMKMNLDVEKFRNGDLIPHAITEDDWKKASESGQPAWCYYGNDASGETKLGKLYNWYAVKDERGIAPTGYHIPTDDEWRVLVDYLGGNKTAGDKLKSMNSWNKKRNCTNSSGFSGLSGGYRSPDGTFTAIGEYGYWWSSSEFNANGACYLLLNCHNDSVYMDYYSKGRGFSVRCLRD